MVLGWKEWLWCILVPMAMSLVAAVVAGSGVNQKAALPRRIAASLIWWLSLAISLFVMSGFEWWSDDTWKRAPWPLLACCFVAAFCSKMQTWKLATLATLAGIAAWVILPTDQGWKDLHSEYPFWSAAIVAGVIWNTWALEHTAARDGQRWYLWIIVASAANVFLMAATCYSAIANWSLAVFATSIVLAIYFSMKPTAWSVSLAAPMVLFASMMIATTRLFSEGRASWFYGITLFLPTMVCAVDMLLFKKEKSTPRVFVAAIVSASLCGLAIWHLLASRPAETW